MSKLSKRVAESLKALRTARGLSQGDVAKRAKVERSYISSVENGKQNLSLQTLEKIANALGLSADDIAISFGKGGEAAARLPFTPGLLAKKLPRWKGKQWYHQRFDGCPYLLHMIAEAEVWTDKDAKKKDGLGFSVHFCFFDGGKADWYILQDDIDRVAATMTARTKEDPRYVAELIASWDEAEERFYAACEEIEAADLRALSDQELAALHDRFVDIAVARNSSSAVIDGFALGTDVALEGRLKEIYGTSALKKAVPFSEVFGALTAPVRRSFLAEAEEALYELAAAVDAEPAKKEALVKAYRDRYFWIRNNYVDSLNLPAHYFEDEVARIRSSGIDPKRQAREVGEALRAAAAKKREYRAALSIDAETDALIRTTEAFTHWQDDRKKSTLYATHYFLLLLGEIGARAGMSPDLLKFMSPRQVSAVLKEAPDTLALKRTAENGVFYWDEEGHDAAHGARATQVRSAVLGEAAADDLKDFRGIAASLGKASGKVKVVGSAKEIGKVEKGDILVAVMTRPDYVPAMRKAAAIVTDEGGITSHAAIVSRELKIPCVIGTKVATRVLKDGDVVEVDANHGVVKRVG